MATNAVDGNEHVVGIMRLMRLMKTYSEVLDWVGDSVEIDGTTPDSARVLPGYLFVALPDAGGGGQGRVHQALLKGALGVLGGWPPHGLPENLPWRVFTYLHVLGAVKA